MNNTSTWESALSGLTSDQLATVKAVKAHAERLLDHSPRFKYFTLHGQQHLNSLFQILGLFREGGINFSNEELFVLAVAICIHDLGMIVSLRDKEIPRNSRWETRLPGRHNLGKLRARTSP